MQNYGGREHGDWYSRFHGNARNLLRLAEDRELDRRIAFNGMVRASRPYRIPFESESNYDLLRFPPYAPGGVDNPRARAEYREAAAERAKRARERRDAALLNLQRDMRIPERVDAFQNRPGRTLPRAVLQRYELSQMRRERAMRGLKF